MNSSFMPMAALLLSQNEMPSIFPFPRSFHFIVVAIAVIFFIISFIRYKKPYQLVFAVAFPLSLFIWKAENNRTLFYIIGAVEFSLLLFAFILSIVCKDKSEKSDKQNTAAESKMEG